MSETLVQIGAARRAPAPEAGATRAGRPEWLRIKLATPAEYHKVRKLVEGLSLNTVCQEARCPNIYECWGQHGTATFMILGDTCTRRCGFCAVNSGRPPAGPDPAEPEHVAEAVETMGLRHAVITSVDRDDLADGGAGHWAAVIRAVHARNPGTAVEVLTPDFRNVPDALDVVLAERPEVFSHNMETVPRMYRKARPGSRYERSLALLAEAARRRDAGEYPGRVKTGIMVGIGERPEEVYQTLADIRGAGVEVMTLGQYLQPTAEHLPVDRWVTPEEFADYKRHALELGFAHCESGPLVRSSYHAHEHVPGGRGPVPDGQGPRGAAEPAPAAG
ncbi:MAG TPA: lipoyl synthase [Thermoanaerobaculia bacterium]|nr:lipoyl synthase [Thermoanaerobaculia bacterium]